jgi:CRP-like cAMP-binding protein
MQARHSDPTTASGDDALMRKLLKQPTTSDSKLAMLRRVPAFRACSGRELASIARSVDEFALAEGHELTREGTPSKEAFVIVEGWAAVIVDGEPVAALGPGEFVGEVGMLDHGPRTATVVAKTPMVVLVVGPAAFVGFAEQPRVARSLNKTLAERLRKADETRGDSQP